MQNGPERATKKREKKGPLNKYILSHILDGDFELVPLGEDPSKNMKIKKELTELVPT